MNILFSISYYAPYISGLTIYAKNLAEALQKKGHTVRVLCIQHESQLKINEIINGVSVYRVQPHIRISKGFIAFGWIRNCYRLIQKSDTVVIHVPQFEGMATALLARVLGKTVICIYHCDVVLPSGLNNKIIQYILDGANIISLSLSDRIITNSEDYAEHSRILRKFLPKMSYVYPPIIRHQISAENKIKLNKKIGSRDITVGAMSRLASEKGVQYAIQAIQRLQSSDPSTYYKIVIAGPTNPVGESAYTQTMLQLIKRAGDRIVLLGALSDDEVGAFYALLDVFVLPSLNSTEAFGMVQVEAMLAGIPVIVSDLPGVRIPVKRTGMGIIVPPGDSESIAQSIQNIIRNKKRFIQSAQSIQNEFDFDTSITAIEKIIENKYIQSHHDSKN